MPSPLGLKLQLFLRWKVIPRHSYFQEKLTFLYPPDPNEILFLEQKNMCRQIFLIAICFEIHVQNSHPKHPIGGVHGETIHSGPSVDVLYSPHMLRIQQQRTMRPANKWPRNHRQKQNPQQVKIHSISPFKTYKVQASCSTKISKMLLKVIFSATRNYSVFQIQLFITIDKLNQSNQLLTSSQDKSQNSDELKYANWGNH